MPDNKQPVCFRTDEYLPDYPIVIIDIQILLTLWSKDAAYIADITASKRYTKEKIEGDYERLISCNEPIQVPFLHVQQASKKDPSIVFSDGRHRVRYLIDSCGATQIPIMTDAESEQFLIARNYARVATQEEQEIMRVRNRNQDALSFQHRVYDILREAGIPPMRETYVPALEVYYAEHEYCENLVPLEQMRDYFRPFPNLREPVSWQSSSLLRQITPRSP